jgi:hypothetical protein
LDNWTSSKDAEEAAKGWSGDNLTYYERDGDEYLFTWKIAWDSNDDAREFYSTFQAMMDTTSAEKDNGYWSAYGRYISIQWNENSTLIVSSDNATFVQQPFIY